jgi:hypothetical protein
MHWECLVWTWITFIAGYLIGSVFGCPLKHAPNPETFALDLDADPAEDGVRGSADECACCETCTCAEKNERLRESMRRKAPWEEF